MAKKKAVRKKKSKNKAGDPPVFEQSLEALEEIVAELEGGDLGLADALEKYEIAARHLQNCQSQLDRAERKIEVLSGVDAAGNPVTRPLDDETAANFVEKGAPRRRPATKTGRRAKRADVDDDRALF